MIQPLAYTDFYKTDHRSQYPPKTEFIYSNFTARQSRDPNITHTVVFGIQYFLKEYLLRRFDQGFFKMPKVEAIARYKRRLDTSLGNGAVSMQHIEDLHDLGYLPLHIKALPEGTRCPIRTPCLTIVNTHAKFFWLTNFVETMLSNCLWMPMTSATTAYEYRRLLDMYAKETSSSPEFVDFQGHDFSMRGMSSMESAGMSGAGHLLSFRGTDTIPAIDFLEDYYEANADRELIGASVPATEHSVMCLGLAENERNTIWRIIRYVYPTGIVSIVSDTWDYWKLLTETYPSLRKEIMARDGKVVVRPDSGDPVKIVCGDPDSTYWPIRNGSIETLWDTFGGTMNGKGYRELDPHIGLIYGDSITLERARAICEGLKKRKFASTNVVFGIGSYTYQYVTRDTFNFAMKSTHGVVNGASRAIQKHPMTDSGMKNSLRGLLRVNEDLTVTDEVSSEEEKKGMLRTIFLDGKLQNVVSLSEIRNRLHPQES